MAKGTLGVAASIVLAATTPVRRAAARAGAAARCPRCSSAIAGFMVRYADVIVGEMRRMRIARDLPRPRPPLDLAGPGGGRLGRDAVHPLLRAGRAGLPGHGVARLRRGDAGARATGRDPRPVAGRARLPAAAALVAAAAWVASRPHDRRRSRSTGVAFAYPDGHQALFGVDFASARRAGGPARAQRGRQDHPGAALNGMLLPARGRVVVAGLPVGKPSTSRRSGAGSASSSRTPTTSCSCRRWPRTWPSGRPTSACAAPSSSHGSTRPLGRGGHGGARRPRRRTTCLRAAAPGRGGHRAGHGAGHPGAGRAVVQPRPGQPPRAGRDPARPRRHHADGHPRPAVRPRSCARGRWSWTTGRSSPTGRRPSCSPTPTLLAANRLELPFGFDPAALRAR